MPDFVDVRRAEREEIVEARRRRLELFPGFQRSLPGVEDSATTGLAFSGGGIRSATFNLGILQALARYNLLPRVDYISTVSGGGYIGSWLVSWIRRCGLKAAICDLASTPPRPPLEPERPVVPMGPTAQPLPSEDYKEALPINFLRAYSNYLTPRLGALSADVWAAVASYLRNLLLNLAILVLSLSAVLLLPRVWEAALLEIASYAKKSPGTAPSFLLFAVAAFLLLAITLASWNIASHSFPQVFESSFTKQKWVLLLVVAPLFVAAPLGCIALWLASPKLCSVGMGSWAVWGSIVYGTLRSIGVLLSDFWLIISEPRPPVGRKEQVKESLGLAAWAFVAGPLGGVLIGRIARDFHAWAPLASTAPKAWQIAKVACWGTPLLVGALLLTGVLHIGLMSFQFSNQKREWWARMTGWLLICCLSSAVLFGLGIYAPLAVALLGGYTKTKAAIIVGWIVSTVGGVLAGKSGSTSGTSDASSRLEIVGKIAPYVFVLGLLVALSTGIHRVVSPAVQVQSGVEENAKVSGDLTFLARDSNGRSMATLTEGESPSTLSELKLTYSSTPPFNSKAIQQAYWSQLQSSADRWVVLKCLCLPGFVELLCLALLFAGVSLAISTRVDINEFSMHLLYRNRLVRCYLGASNEKRKPQLFTGFDPNDDTLLKDFSVFGTPYKNENNTKKDYAGPYPILNCTLTVTHGERLAWQERRGESFIFSPRYCGYEFQEQSPIEDGPGAAPHAAERMNTRLENRDREHLVRPREKKEAKDGYQETGGYAYPPDGVYLGTALATSGAAVNPNMGFHTSSALAFLMTVFNVRLGWWLGNPRRPETRGRATPRLGMFYLLMELFALTSDRSRYVNLSDGFHFENLGLYELVRRRCKYIIVGDAGADPEHSFDDLANAIRKCRTDFGIEIELDLTALKLDKDTKFSSAHAVAGVIRYDLIEPDEEKGILIYFKPTLTEDDPADIQNYRTTHPVFPHQSTANQWFDESQFESYRQLGRISAETVLKLAGTPDELRSKPTSEVFETLSTMI